MAPVPLVQRAAFCRLLSDWCADFAPAAPFCPSPVPSGRTEWVYFSISQQLRIIKVGWSVKPIARMSSLSGGFGDDHELVALVADADRWLEFATLKTLRPFLADRGRRHNTEMFRLDSPVLDLVASLREAANASFFDNKRAPLSGPKKSCRFCRAPGRNALACGCQRAVAYRARRWSFEKAEAA